MKTIRLFLSLFLILFLLCACQQTSVPDKVNTRSVTSTTASSLNEIKSADKSFSTDKSSVSDTTTTQKSPAAQYVLNLNTKKFHKPGCSSVKQMKDKNKKYVTMSRDDIIADGYSPCGRCNP